MDLLNTLVEKGLRRELPTREEALAVLATSDDELLDVVAAAGKVRRQWFGRRVKLNYLVNLKCGGGAGGGAAPAGGGVGVGPAAGGGRAPERPGVVDRRAAHQD
ncbi:hypothetical protein ACFWVK_17615, partial [Streptomyces sp. NPDC058667]